MRKLIRSIYLFVFIILLSINLLAQSNNNSIENPTCKADSAQIMVLGTYHMHNPKYDSVIFEADDVLSERRQKEIDELLNQISKYRPTKIAIESPYKNRVWQTRYREYLKGNYKLGRNEIEQIGFKLAKRLNLKTLYSIDFPLRMSGFLSIELENPPVKPKKKTKDNVAKKPRVLSRSEKILRKSTISEYLYRMNEKKNFEKNHEQYMKMMLPDFEDSAIYYKADKVTNWYKRNLRMFSNLNRISKFNNDERVLLIVGAGHLKLLTDFADDAPQFCLVSPLSYLTKPNK